MLRKTLLFAGLAAISAWAGADEDVHDAPLVVIDRSMNFPKGTFPQAGPWYGLYCKAMDCELKQVAVTVKSTGPEDQAPEVLDVDGDPLALFHGVDLNPGPVSTWYKLPENQFLSGQYTSLLRLGHWEMPGGDQPLTLSWVKLPEGNGRHYLLSDGKYKQLMFSSAGDAIPVVNWVGDLDGDGKPDFLMSMPDDSCGHDERLYLSSQAGTGELVHKAAMLGNEQDGSGC
jgi:hypothetical protein